jgi:thiamine biosynthesis lipoprotein
MRSNRRNFLNFVRQGTPAIDPCWLHVNRTAMACKFEITLSMSAESGVVVASSALDEIDRLEAQLSVFRETSEVSLINQRAADEPVQIEKSLFDLLQRSQSIYEETDGAFDITSNPLTRCWGFLKREGRIPARAEIETARLNVGSDKFFPQLPSALLNAGASSMVALGKGERGEGWMVGLRHPRSKLRRLGVVYLTDCALATSGSEEQFFEYKSVRYGHIIDPRTGWPAKSVTSVSVVTDSGALSDALATAFYVGGRELAERYCATHPEVLAIMLESSATSPVVIGSHSRCVGPLSQ